MPLKALSTQTTSVYAFYRRLAALGPLNVYAKVGEQMLDLLPRLERLCAERDAWAMPTHEALGLLAKDDAESEVIVMIEPLPLGGFRIGYRMPPEQAPWTNAMVEGLAEDPAHASDLVAVAMRRSGAWG